MGGEGHFEKLKQSIALYAISLIFISGVVLIGTWHMLSSLALPQIVLFGILLSIWLITSVIFGSLIANRALKPLQFLSQAILYVSPNQHLEVAPNLDKLKTGHELISNLVRQVYDFASNTSLALPKANETNNILEQLPLPVIGLNNKGEITLINKTATAYLEQTESLLGRNIYEIMDLSFKNHHTLDSWLETVRSTKATDKKTWEHVQLQLPSGLHYIDIAVEFHKQEGEGTETSLVLFDHTKTYIKDDDALSFIALAVHELRTPLTILRGYIEAMNEELATTASPEIQGFMHKMEASAENVTTFVSNILNVARVDQNQLSLTLAPVNWEQLLTKTTDNLRLRAKVRGIDIELTVAKDLPQVAADTTTISEVVNNIVENAIKYSAKEPNPGKIVVTSKLNQEGLVETTVQDSGCGIPVAVLPTLFERFSRNHKTRAVISGNGLGLFLSKTIITAHKGNIWVRSTEGQGSTFGFTLMPYDKLASQVQTNDNKDMVVPAEGWIKNHTLYRR